MLKRLRQALIFLILISLVPSTTTTALSKPISKISLQDLMLIQIAERLGYGYKAFKPEELSLSVTREKAGEILFDYYQYTLLNQRSFKFSYQIIYSDTKSGKIQYLASEGILKGITEKQFKPKDRITREQFALALYQLLKKHGAKMTYQSKLELKDENQLSKGAAVAVKTILSQQLMSAVNKQFDPASPVSLKDMLFALNTSFKKYGVLEVESDEELLLAVEQNYRMTFANDQLKQAYDEAKTMVTKHITKSMSDYERVVRINDYLVLNIAYDYENYQRNRIPDESYSVYGALVLGKAVCQGYANAAKLLLNLSNIEAYVVTGTAANTRGGHAWNKLKVDGKYYNLDVTWNDPVPDQPGQVSYAYLNVTDKELSLDHQWEDQLPVASDTEANYYVRNKLLVSSKKELANRILQALLTKQKTLVVRLDGFAASREDIKSMIFDPDTSVSRYSYTSDSLGRTFQFTFEYR